MKKFFTICFALLLFNSFAMAITKNINLRIIETSDVHGCFFPYDFINRQPMNGSLARVSTYVNKLRNEYGDNLILLDNGDILQGQPICYYFNYVNNKMNNVAADIINYMKYDAVTIGNHDVETGHKVYDKWLKEVKCPVLGANVIDVNTDYPYLKPYVVINRQNIKIAILGMLTPAIPNWLTDDLWKGLKFNDMVSTARYWIKYIKEKENPDFIVGLFHSGNEGGITNSEYCENASFAVAREVPGFDVILYGHDHVKRSNIIKSNAGDDVLCLDPSCNAIFVSDAQINVTIKNGKIIDKKVIGSVHDICSEEVDNKFLSNFNSQIDSVKNYVDRKIGDFKQSIYTRDCYFGNSPFTDFILNLETSISGADIAFNAPLSFNICINEGPVYVSDMFKLYRFENQLYTLKMTGKEIHDYLEMSYDLWVNTMKSPEDHIMLLNEQTQGDMQRYGFQNFTFNFDSASGINYIVDVTKPNGKKVTILNMTNGQPFVYDKWYKVAMNSYRGNGGGELLTKGAGIPLDSITNRILTRSELDLRYYLMKEIEKMKTVYPKANNNWKFVPEEWSIPAIARDKQLLFGK